LLGKKILEHPVVTIFRVKTEKKRTEYRRKKTSNWNEINVEVIIFPVLYQAQFHEDV